MFDWSGSTASIQNLLELAKACDNANNQKFYDVPDPFPTTDGEMTRATTLGHVARSSPSVIAYRRANRVVIAVAGIQGAADALQVYQGYLSLQPLPFTAGQVNAYAKTWFDAAFPVLEAHWGQTITEFVFVGHSWGGAVATLLAMRLKAFRSSVSIRLVTFASPRFATAGVFESLQGIGHLRVHADRDPVPYVMPWFFECPLVHMIQDPVTCRNFNSMTHPGTGLFIKRGQQPAYQDYSDPSRPGRDLTVNGVRAILAGSSEAHWPSTYVSIMQDNYDDLAPRFHGPANHPAPHRSVEAPPVGPAEAEAITDFPEKPWPEDAVPRGHPRAPLPPPPPPPVPFPGVVTKQRARLKKSGGRWRVYIGESLVYTGTGKRDARGVARAIRGIAEQYEQNTLGFTDPSILLDQAAGLEPQI